MSETFNNSLDLSVSENRSTKGDGVWDDGELIRAYDAALEEFHVHHPGPGTWLDKVTAAAMQGKPVEGAKAYGTEWYEKSEKRTPDELDQPIPLDHQQTNPYNAPVTKKNARAASPTYAPPSPSKGDHEVPALVPPPKFAVSTAAAATYEEAIALAMSAQYTAGYWLGVAHTKASGGRPGEDSNILHTQYVAELKR